MNASKLKDQLKKQEGTRLLPYKCSAGALTIGVGRNLDVNGIRESEAELMLDNDIDEVYKRLRDAWPKIILLDDARQNVLVNMAFNLGVSGLMGFHKTLNAISLADYELAAGEMLNSKWAIQVGQRAIDLSNQMKTGEYQ